MADVDFKFADVQDRQREQAANALALQAYEQEPPDFFSRNARGIGAGGAIVGSSIMGMMVEGATMRDLAVLRTANPSIWSSYTAAELGSVRGALANAPSYMGTAEREMLHTLNGRGAFKGLAAGAAGIAGSIAVDALLFGDTRRTEVSKFTDMVGLPLVSLLPINPYAKAAAIVTAHTLGRLYDKHFA
jgi:hypothetical protein